MTQNEECVFSGFRFPLSFSGPPFCSFDLLLDCHLVFENHFIWLCCFSSRASITVTLMWSVQCSNGWWVMGFFLWFWLETKSFIFWYFSSTSNLLRMWSRYCLLWALRCLCNFKDSLLSDFLYRVQYFSLHHLSATQKVTGRTMLLFHIIFSIWSRGSKPFQCIELLPHKSQVMSSSAIEKISPLDCIIWRLLRVLQWNQHGVWCLDPVVAHQFIAQLVCVYWSDHRVLLW